MGRGLGDDGARNALAEAAGDGGTLRLASMECTAAVRLPPLLARDHAAWPRVSLALVTNTSEAILQAVLDRQVDWGFIGGPIHHPRVVGTLVYVEPMVLAVPPGVTSLAEADARAVPHSEMRAWLLEIAEGNFDALPPEPRLL